MSQNYGPPQNGPACHLRLKDLESWTICDVQRDHDLDELRLQLCCPGGDGDGNDVVVTLIVGVDDCALTFRLRAIETRKVNVYVEKYL